MDELTVQYSRSVTLESNHEPLYKRVPTRDENGKPLSDFMILIPGLKHWVKSRFDDRLAGLQAVLGECTEVVFADLNVPLNLLWVSVKSRHGVINELAGQIQHRIPEAKLISHHVPRATSS